MPKCGPGALDGQFPDGLLGPVSPHMCGSPNAVLKTPRSERIVSDPNKSMIAIVLPCPWFPMACKVA
jgi:hypothetical protein